MAIRIGTEELGSLRIGRSAIAKVMLGTGQIWPVGSPTEAGTGYANWSFDEATRTIALFQVDTTSYYPWEYDLDIESWDGYVDDDDY